MPDYGTWKGMAREKIPWHPTVDLSKCEGCRKCFEFCSHGVYGWDEVAGKPKVVEPFQCVVGCSSCSQVCEQGVVTFPPLSVLKPFMGGE